MAFLIPDLVCETIYDIPICYFTDRGINLLMLDIDNTLVTYDDEYPTEENRAWFRALSEQGIDVVFISNNHGPRVEKYAEAAQKPYYPDAKKPFCTKHKQVMRERGLEPQSCAAVGDQIFTDVLAAHLAGSIAVLVSPIKDLTGGFTRFKRLCEKPFLALYKRKYKNGVNYDE